MRRKGTGRIGPPDIERSNAAVFRRKLAAPGRPQMPSCVATMTACPPRAAPDRAMGRYGRRPHARTDAKLVRRDLSGRSGRPAPPRRRPEGKDPKAEIRRGLGPHEGAQAGLYGAEMRRIRRPHGGTLPRDPLRIRRRTPREGQQKAKGQRDSCRHRCGSFHHATPWTLVPCGSSLLSGRSLGLFFIISLWRRRTDTARGPRPADRPATRVAPSAR